MNNTSRTTKPSNMWYWSETKQAWLYIPQMHWKHLLNAFRRDPQNKALYNELVARMERAFEPTQPEKPYCAKWTLAGKAYCPRPTMGDSLRKIADALNDIANDMR